tara:strand:- start:56 stop:289 length:234 start_codon:yes stop_codon:yes gene_type:complete
MLIKGNKAGSGHELEVVVKDGKLTITADLKPMESQYLSKSAKSFNVVCSGGRKEIILENDLIGTLNLCLSTKNPEAY